MDPDTQISEEFSGEGKYSLLLVLCNIDNDTMFFVYIILDSLNNYVRYYRHIDIFSNAGELKINSLFKFS